MALFGSPQLDACFGTRAAKQKAKFIFLVVSRLDLLVGKGSEVEHKQSDTMDYIPFCQAPVCSAASPGAS